MKNKDKASSTTNYNLNLNINITELIIDECQYIEILTIFNEKLCIPLSIYRNGSEFGLKNETMELFSNFSKIIEIHNSLYHELKNIETNDYNNYDIINNIFNKYIDKFNKMNIDLIEKI